MLDILKSTFTLSTMKSTEAKIQAEIVQYLQAEKFLFCSVPNEAAGKDAAIRMAKLKTMGLKSGAPDLLVFLQGGRTLGLEVKSPTGAQSPAQIDFGLKMAERGHLYFVVRSVDDVKKIVERVR